jgi:hypothetical protein
LQVAVAKRSGHQVQQFDMTGRRAAGGMAGFQGLAQRFREQRGIGHGKTQR